MALPQGSLFRGEKPCHCESVRRLACQSVLLMLRFFDYLMMNGTSGKRIPTVASLPRNDIHFFDTLKSTYRTALIPFKSISIEGRIPMISSAIIFSALELGCIYALVALALFLSFRVLNIADMTTDGVFTLGCAVSATFAVAGHPILGLPAAMLAGACAGSVTAFLQTKLQIPSILAGIITNTGLYTVNLAVMGFSSNVNMMKAATVFSMVQPIFGKALYKLIPVAILIVCVGILLALFLKTRLGLSIRATGDNPDMVRASSINTGFTITVGLCVSNSLTALSGAVLAQYQKTADINLGTGMVIIGLASLIIGETLLPKGKTWLKILGAVLGSIVYRFIIAIALRMDLPSECLKLISATIVALAIGLPAIKSSLKPATAKGGK